MGDLNANSGDKEINTLLAELPNGSILKDSTSDELGGAYNKWGGSCGERRIDYVLSSGWRANLKTAARHPEKAPSNEVEWPSDHCGYSVELIAQ